METNQKNSKTVVWTLVAVALATAIFVVVLLVRRKNKDKDNRMITTTSPSQTTEVKSTSYTDTEIDAKDVDVSLKNDQKNYFPLMQGVNTWDATVNYVKKLQEVLNYYGAATIPVTTNLWGSKTEAGMSKLMTLKGDVGGLTMPLFPSITKNNGYVQVASVDAYDMIIDQWQQDSAAGTRKNALK